MADNESFEDTAARFGRAATFYEQYDERRVFPRIKMHESAEILLGGKVLPVVIYDISPDGMQLRCDREVAQVINPTGRRIEVGKGPVVGFRCQLPLRDGPAAFSAECQVWWFALTPQGQVALGFRFKDTSLKDRSTLSRFIEYSMEPRPDV
jgi:hypothetical protein